jgi:hypothetical protein
LSEELEARVKRFLEEVSLDWGVTPPDVYIHPGPLYAAGMYDDYYKIIHLDPECVTLRVVLHEFAHHLQHELGLGIDDPEFLEREVRKPHCERVYERQAKVFEKSFDRFYERLWREIVGGEKG